MPSGVLVVGGGVIGLSAAWQLSRAGHQVTVVAPDPGRDGASWVAAGMLAPVTEAQFGEAALTSLLLEGASQWKGFAADLEEASGHDIGFNQSGTLTVALSPSDRAVLHDLLAHQVALGCTAHRRSASACRALVPALAPTLSGGIEAPGDHQVDNRALLAALLAAGRAEGVRYVATTVTRLAPGTDGPTVQTADDGIHRADTVVLAAGVGTPAIGGLEAAGLPAIRPVKGHILRLRPRDDTPALARTVRALAHGRSVYLVPRRDGTVVVGATVEERGVDTVVQAGAVHQLLSDARAVVPAIDEFELLESQAGLRPATIDNTPFIGWTGLPGVVAATGHFRNGILLAPYTAAALVALLAR